MRAHTGSGTYEGIRGSNSAGIGVSLSLALALSSPGVRDPLRPTIKIAPKRNITRFDAYGVAVVQLALTQIHESG
jgi:hypothetical protein